MSGPWETSVKRFGPCLQRRLTPTRWNQRPTSTPVPDDANVNAHERPILDAATLSAPERELLTAAYEKHMNVLAHTSARPELAAVLEPILERSRQVGRNLIIDIADRNSQRP